MNPTRPQIKILKTCDHFENRLEKRGFPQISSIKISDIFMKSCTPITIFLDIKANFGGMISVRLFFCQIGMGCKSHLRKDSQRITGTLESHKGGGHATVTLAPKNHHFLIMLRELGFWF